MQITFAIPGIPKPGGSKRAFMNRKTGKAMIVDTCKGVSDWKGDIKYFAAAAYSGPLLDGAIELEVDFYLPRPKGHFGSGKNAAKLKPSAPEYPLTKPDALKLLRPLEDALTGVIWKDDCLIVRHVISKNYADTRLAPGAVVRVALCP